MVYKNYTDSIQSVRRWYTRIIQIVYRAYVDGIQVRTVDGKLQLP